MIAIGVDCTGGSHAFICAVLDADLRVAGLTEMGLDELLQFLKGWDSAAVAVNSPSSVNAGIVRRRAEGARPGTGSNRGTDVREAEHELHAVGIGVGSTPRLEALCPGWVQMGFGLYRGLEACGFLPYPAKGAPRQWLETHPHAGFCALLGGLPLPKPTLEGRLQRALALFEKGVRMRDPMGFLEEITRHRLLHGLLPLDEIPTPDQLDALLAAYTAWLATAKPGEVSQIGNQQEGHITIPAARLLENYSVT